MPDQLQEKLRVVFRDIRKLFRFINTFSPCNVADPSRIVPGETAKFPLPKEIGFEFCSVVSHLLVIKKIHKERPSDACAEADKAGRHVTRALLDYVKYHAIMGQSRAHPFLVDTKIIQARLAECAGIGTNHNGAMAQYLDILDLHYGKRVDDGDEKIGDFSIEIDGDICAYLEQFFQLEAVFSGLRGEKLNEVLSEFLRIFSLRLSPIPHLENQCRYMALLIMARLWTTHGDKLRDAANEKGYVKDWVERRKHFAELRKMGKEAEANALVVGLCFSLFDVMMRLSEEQ